MRRIRAGTGPVRPAEPVTRRAPIVSARPLSEQAYDIVEDLIVRLELEPGQVFSEQELSERVGIGRTPLREALRQLADERLVVTLPRRGMMIAEINASEYLALLDTRRVLDRLIAERAARLATPAQRDELGEIAVGMGTSGSTDDVAGFLRLDRASDSVMMTAARNPYATRAVSPLHVHCRRFWNLHKHAGDLAASAELHAGLLEAAAAGHAEDAGRESDRLIDYLEAFTRSALDLN